MALGPPLSIERATLDDAEKILGCLRAAFAPYRTQYTPAAYEDTVMTGESVRHRLETTTVLVARDDQGRIIGTVGAAAHGTEGHIRGMAVVPSFQGGGVADQLLEALERELKAAGCSRVTLDTTAPPMLRHCLAAIAYRTQKALRDAPPSFGTFDAGSQVRTPTDLVRHMTSVLGHARRFFVGGRYRAEPLTDLSAEIVRFHEMLADLAHNLETGTELRGTTEERLLQGPLSDAMAHAGQLAMLRRLAGSPVRPENFMEAAIDPKNVGPSQPAPVSLLEWPQAPKPVL